MWVKPNAHPILLTYPMLYGDMLDVSKYSTLPELIKVDNNTNTNINKLLSNMRSEYTSIPNVVSYTKVITESSLSSENVEDALVRLSVLSNNSNIPNEPIKLNLVKSRAGQYGYKENAEKFIKFGIYVNDLTGTQSWLQYVTIGQ